VYSRYIDGQIVCNETADLEASEWSMRVLKETQTLGGDKYIIYSTDAFIHLKLGGHKRKGISVSSIVPK
jgi:hypothetical protein